MRTNRLNGSGAVKALFTIWKYAYSEDFLTTVKRVFELIKSINPAARIDEYLKLILHYLEETREEEEYIEIKKIAETEINEGDYYMGTIAEMFRREGDERTLLEKPKWIEHGIEKGKKEYAQENLVDIATEQYGPLPRVLYVKIRSISTLDSLRALTRKVIKTESLEEFIELVNRVAHN